MSKNLLSAILTAATLVAPVALACEGHEKQANASQRTIKDVTVTDVADMQKAKRATVLDANRDEFRQKHGIIPSSVLLTHYQNYDVAKELPADKAQTLVFYCANTQCTASHAAAKRALEAGYSDVNVLKAGLMGWKEAGQSTAQATPRS